MYSVTIYAYMYNIHTTQITEPPKKMQARTMAFQMCLYRDYENIQLLPRLFKRSMLA
jgi:hypothetical protein